MKCLRLSVATLMAFGVLLASSSAAAAQGVARSFEQLQLLVRDGDTVTVREESGAETTGRITGLSTEGLTLIAQGEGREFREADVTVIRQRRSDSLRNGALWGLLVGGAASAVPAAILCRDRDCGVGMVWGVPFYAGLGAGIGVGVDAMIAGLQDVYRRPSSARLTLAPMLDRGQRGLLVAWRF